MNRNRNSLLYNILLWVALYALWIFVFRNNTFTLSRTVGIQFCYLVFVALNFYFNIYFAIPQLLVKRKYAIYLVVALLFLAATAWMRAEVALYINANVFNTPAQQLKFIPLYLTSLLNIFIWSMCIIAGKMIIDRVNHQRQALIMEQERIKNELNFLRAQNNPHFLFNTLNSVYFQIDKSNPQARETLMRLSEILRYQLYDCAAEKIMIDKEIDFLKNYIELQKLRLDNNYKIEFYADKDVNGFMVAPLLLMPLIENAFKYVSHFSNGRCNEINIKLTRKDNIFSGDINNTIEHPPEAPTANGGIGLQNLRRRLELLYPRPTGLRALITTCITMFI